MPWNVSGRRGDGGCRRHQRRRDNSPRQAAEEDSELRPHSALHLTLALDVTPREASEEASQNETRYGTHNSRGGHD